MVHTAHGLFKNLWAHDRRSHRQDHAPIQTIHACRKFSKINLGCPPNGSPVEHRMVCDDVVANPGMHCQRHRMTIGRSQHRGVFPFMLQRITPLRHVALPNGSQQLGSQRSQLPPGIRFDASLKRLGIRKLERLIFDQASKRRSITLPLYSTGEKCKMDITAGFLPCPECAGGHIGPNAFARPAQPRILPIMNRPGPICRQMSQLIIGQKIV